MPLSLAHETPLYFDFPRDFLTLPEFSPGTHLRKFCRWQLDDGWLPKLMCRQNFLFDSFSLILSKPFLEFLRWCPSE